MKIMQERRDVQTMIQSNVSKNFLRSISPLSIPTCDCQAHPTWSKIKQVLLKKNEAQYGPKLKVVYVLGDIHEASKWCEIIL